MMHDNPFSDAEIARRLAAFRAELSTLELDGAVKGRGFQENLL